MSEVLGALGRSRGYGVVQGQALPHQKHWIIIRLSDAWFYIEETYTFASSRNMEKRSDSGNAEGYQILCSTINFAK
jgi:hypothetical protein